MIDKENPETEERPDGPGDTLDLGIQAAFGIDPEMDAPTTRSVLKKFKRGGKGSQISLRDPDDEHTPVALSPKTGHDEQPSTINRYQVAGEIARGGIGSVLKARDADLGRDVALKVLLHTHRDNAEVTRRFLEEAQIGGQLQHPGIVPVHEIGVLADDRPYFAMKLVKGQTLAELLESRADHNEGRQRFLGIFEQVCQTLAYAHTRGVIHRDLKPSNIMVGTFGEVQVMDWGLAKVLARGGVADERRTTRALRDESVVRTMRTEDHGSASVAGSVMGTPAYMPPEQARGAVDELDERSDVFGLGAILCEILTGKPPYTGEDLDEIYSKARAGDLGDAFRRLELCGADRELVDLARSCLAVDPRQRPRNGVVVAKRINAHLESVERRAHELKVRSAKTRLKLALALFVLIGVVLGGGGYLWVDKERQAQEQATMEAVRDATRRAGELRNRATLQDDPSFLQAALRESERAVELAAKGTDQGILETTTNFHAELQAQVRDQDMAEKLERLREEMDADEDELDRNFKEAFSSYGIDVENLDVEVAADRIRDSEIANELVLALDQWAVAVPGRYDRRRRGGPPPGNERTTTLFDPFELAKRADRDAWRTELRQAREDRDIDKLKRLAAEAETKHLEPSTLELLASAFEKFGRRGWGRPSIRMLRQAREERDIDKLKRLAAEHVEPSTLELLASAFESTDRRGRGRPERTDGSDFQSWERRIRIRAQQLHPHDFWINVRLGDFFLGERDPDQALQYLRAAVALRPRSAYALEKLGLALAGQGSSTEALAQLGKSISIDPQLRRGRAYDTGRELLEESGENIPRESLQDLLATLSDVVASGREHNEEARIRLLAHTEFVMGRYDRAILVLEGFARARDKHVGRGLDWSGRRGRPGRPGGPGRSGRRGPPHRRQLERYREAVRPDLVSFASIDAVFDAPDSEASRAEILEKFRELHDGTAENGARARLLYLEGRQLQRAGRHADAVSRFSEVVVREDSLPEPFLRLAESLRASGEAARAVTTLREAIEVKSLGDSALWKLWARVSLVDLRLSAAQALSAFPEIPSRQNRTAGVTDGEDLEWVLRRLTSGEGIHINSGGDRYEGSDGTTWGRDRFFTPGSFSFLDRPWWGPRAFFGSIKGTNDEPLYQTDRVFFSRPGSGAGYEIPVALGEYEVTLHFAEITPWAKDNPEFKRAFDVVIEGKVARKSYDPGQRGFATADHWRFQTTVEDGSLDIHFVSPEPPEPKVSAIAVARVNS